MTSQFRTVKRVTYTTELPIAEVLSRLDRAINRDKGAYGQRVQSLNDKSKEEVEGLVHDVVGDGFTFFFETNHTNWLRPLLGENTPEVHVYHIGNPLIARTILQHDLIAGLYVPPKLFISGPSGPDNQSKGTTVIYDVPSSIIGTDGNAELKAATKVLDEKLEGLVKAVIAVSVR
ncbi:hypothetical protein EVG20_g6924 [Dentipellis fragilis]|uniref:DUF302 domain-containing protein n=1 Tax=Dentipellis fragilis TaxID=205917 RepID=A0A4Y9YGU7_9AGAM|nr:hypothetical protein EVG20_g6924 [Dentipellis fragilis]